MFAAIIASDCFQLDLCCLVRMSVLVPTGPQLGTDAEAAFVPVS